MTDSGKQRPRRAFSADDSQPDGVDDTRSGHAGRARRGATDDIDSPFTRPPFSALFYAEFASRIPANGGAYSYIYAVLGEFPAWLAGWLTIMEFMTAISGVASG